jgi:hypothetical protein
MCNDAGLSSNDIIKMKMVGARAAKVEGVEELPGMTNYLIGSRAKDWHTNIKSYRKVVYRGVYPGIDQVFYGNGEQVEYDFIVSPGANPRAIALTFKGATETSVDQQGDLILRTENSGEVRLHRPTAYQELGGRKREIPSKYVIKGRHKVAFEVAGYDTAKPLVIDPVISYSTYFGGSGNDTAFDVAVDQTGSVYVTGSTDSGEFSPLGSTNSFVAKLNPAGTERVYLAGLGGIGSDHALSLAIDNAGAAYITGATDSPDFPATNSFQLTYGGGVQDAFIAKLNPDGSAVAYATYLGGSKSDAGYGVAVDASGNAYVTGSTNSPELSLLGNTDAFVAKVSPSGGERLYLSSLGGSGDDRGFDVAVDAGGNAYVVGTTESNNFTTANAMQVSLGGLRDCFIAMLNPSGSALLFSTYMGGSGNDAGFAVAVDGTGGIYVTGSTDSPELTALGGKDVFLLKLDSTGARTYFSVFGGDGDDEGFGLAVDSVGDAYVTGTTASSNFTKAGPLPQGASDLQNCFVTKVSPTGATLLNSNLLAGNGEDAGYGVAVDNSHNAYVTGFTKSINFPTVTPLQANLGGRGCVYNKAR